MNNKYIYLLVCLIIIVIIVTGIYFFWNREIPIDNSLFTLASDIRVEVYSDSKISSKIENIKGTIIEDKKIDTSKLGKQTIEFLYKNEKGRKRKGIIEIEVADTTEPFLLMGNSYTVTVGYNKNLTDVILSADNYDPNPKREILGDYDMNQVGSYPLTYRITDSSGNIEAHDFTLHVKEKSISSSYNKTYTKFEDVISLHKTENTKIGIDVSKWQGEINFDLLKEAGVEFVIIRVGTGLGFNEPSVEDVYFKKNIEGTIKAGIPVGIYYYSYATTIKEAKGQALWVANQLKDYKIDLPVAFDWESWSYFNGLNLSLHDINDIANTFLNEIEKAGYEGILYGSKLYLQNVWEPTEPVWLAHYTTKTDYDGEYFMWQLCENGIVNGINGAVDINVMYK